MKKLREIFSRDKIIQSTSPSWSGNYCFSTPHIPTLSAYTLVHHELRVVVKPLYTIRKYFLVKDITKDIPVQITFSLAWDGFERALVFLFGFTESLDLFFNPEKVLNTRNYTLGNFGVAWGWVPGELNVLAFLRNNVFVGIQGFLPKDEMLSIARSIDCGLEDMSTDKPCQDEKQGFFAQNFEETSTVCVAMGGAVRPGRTTPGRRNILLHNLCRFNEPRPGRP
jgi:hypothetical protein